jgi:hypothetical protein
MFRRFPRPTFLPHGGNIPRRPSADDSLRSKVLANAPARKIARSIHEAARDKAPAIAKTEAYVVSCRERKKVGMLFAHLKRILRLDRLRQRSPNGAKDEFLLADTAQNLRKLAKAHPAPGARIHHMRRRDSASPRLQLPRAHIAIFRAPGTSTLSVDCSRLLCAISRHSCNAWRTGQINPFLPIKIGLMNGR